MFKELGALAGLMKQLPRVKEEVERYQERLSQITAEGDAGGGLVKVRVNGKMEMLSCRLSEDAMKPDDREMLEDLIRAAVNQAFERVRKQVAEETGKMAAGLGLPAGLSLPGFPAPGSQSNP